MLNNTAYKLKHDKNLRVAYFGGSITEGAGSSDPERTCYRAITTAHLKNSYPDAEITEIYAAIGGTGTSLGMFRQKKDVLDFDPDLIFIEFAVNDFGDTEERVLPQIESMLRQIRITSPMTDVVVLISTAQMVLEALEAGKCFESRDAHVRAAIHYGVPVINFGEALAARVYAEEVPYEVYSPDTLHPGDNGYEVMTKYLLSVLDSMLDVCPKNMKAHLLPAPLCENCSEIGDIVPASEIAEPELNGFYYKVEKNDRFEGFLESVNGGDSFSFTFDGIGVGFYRVGGDDGTDLLVSIDGGEPTVNETWDKYVRSFHRMNAAIITKDLPKGRHTVTVTVPEKDEVRVRIAAAFIC